MQWKLSNKFTATHCTHYGNFDGVVRYLIVIVYHGMLFIFIKGYIKYSWISRNSCLSKFKIKFKKLNFYWLWTRIFTVSYSDTRSDKSLKNVVLLSFAKYRIIKCWRVIITWNCREFAFWTSYMFSIFIVSLYCW